LTLSGHLLVLTLSLNVTKVADDRQNALLNRRFGITRQVGKRFKRRILIVFMRHWRWEIVLVPWHVLSYEGLALMTATPNRHILTEMSPAAWLSSINYLIDGTGIEYAAILLCEKA